MRTKLASRGDEQLHLVLMLALTFSTGIIDAVGYLGLDRVFTGNMTGNVVILAMGLVGADDLPIVGPSIALVAFFVGAAIGGRVLRQTAARWSSRTTALLAAVAVALAAAAGALLVLPAEPGSPLTYGVTATLGAAMGLQAATARRLAVEDVTTVVVTSTLTALAAEGALGGGEGTRWKRRAGAVLLIGAGAAAGAALLRWHVGAGLFLAAAVTIAVTIAGALAAARRN